MKPPAITAPSGTGTDFHDSSLIDLCISPTLEQATIVVSTPDAAGIQKLWKITFTGLLRWEFETVGSGAGESYPAEVYDIYNYEGSDEMNRWRQRMADLNEDTKGPSEVLHVVLASSFFRGWGEREELDGIHIICRGYRICPAPREYYGREYSRPIIESSDD